MLIPVGLIVGVCVADAIAPPDIHLGPLLVSAPAITAAFAGPRLTAAVGVLAVAAQVTIGMFRHALATENLIAQIIALVLVSTLIVVFCLVRDRHARQLDRTRSVARAAQRVLLQPLPERSGPLRIASLYIAAEQDADMGGDLYAAARADGTTRLLIGDVRGKGLGAIDHSALLSGAFRAEAHRKARLPHLAHHLDASLLWDSTQWDGGAGADTAESFATAILLDIPDERPVAHMVDCGHPPPLLLRPGGVRVVAAGRPALPIGFGALGGDDGYEEEVFGFGTSDMMLLYTDGVTEARDSEGAFYPLVERAAAWTADNPGELLRHLRDDLLAHTGGRLGDDAAAIAIRRGRPHSRRRRA